MELSGWVFVAFTVIVLGYLVPYLVRSREVMVGSRVTDRYSPQLRLVTPAGPAPPPVSDTRPQVHNPEISRRRTEALAMIRPTTPVANRVNARELAAARAARAAEISRRAAAARRRMTLAAALAGVTAAVVMAVVAGPLAWAWVLAPAAALVVVLYTGRRAAIVSARQDAKARAEMTRLDQRLRLFRAEEAGSPPVGELDKSFEDIVEGYQGRHVATRELEDEPPRHARVGSLTALADGEGRPAAAQGSVWTPVPVPLPTYTLKQESPRRDVEPFAGETHDDSGVRAPSRPTAVAPSFGTAEPEPAAQTFDLDTVLARRRAAGA